MDSGSPHCLSWAPSARPSASAFVCPTVGLVGAIASGVAPIGHRLSFDAQQSCNWASSLPRWRWQCHGASFHSWQWGVRFYLENTAAQKPCHSGPWGPTGLHWAVALWGWKREANDPERPRTAAIGTTFALLSVPWYGETHQSFSRLWPCQAAF